MKNKFIFVSGIIIAVLLLIGQGSCTHDPVVDSMMEEEMNNQDTTTVDTSGQGGGGSGMNPDSTGQSGNNGGMNGDTTQISDPCSPDSIYFSTQILPILLSNCALSGCHDASSAQDGVILTDYNSVVSTAKVKPFDLNDSELYEVITEDDIDKRMPPSPANPLATDQINIIAQWINQGALNLECNEVNTGSCNTSEVSYSADIKPLLDNTCIGCHSGPGASGGVNLSGYANLKTLVDNGRFFGAISWAAGYKRMPQGGAKLDDCTLNKIKSWIDNGAPDN